MCLQENDVPIFSTVGDESNENTSIVWKQYIENM